MRTFVNKPGVEYDATKTTVIFAEDMNEIGEKLEQLESGETPEYYRMGWVFPDSNIDPAANITANVWHTLSAMWYELNASGALVKRDSASHGSNFYFTSQNAATVVANSTVALVNLSSGDAAHIGTLCASSSLRTAAVNELVQFCTDNGFQGVDLDLEGYGTWSATVWADFKTFVDELGTALHAAGFVLSVEVPPIWNTSANGESGSGDAWDAANSQGYYELEYADFNALPVDQLVIMAYDYQYDYSAGEPNQPLQWLDDVLAFAKSQINENLIDIVAGIPAAGYYGATGGYIINNSTYEFLAQQTGFGGASRDVASGELIWANGGNSYACIDDVAIQQKVEKAAERNIRRYALWHVGDNKTGGTALEGTVSSDGITEEEARSAINAPRVYGVDSEATVTPSLDSYDAVDIRAASEDVTIANPTGQEDNKRKLLIEIKDDGTSRTLTWGTKYVAGGADLPAATVAGKITLVGLIYSTANGLNKWRCVAVSQEA